MPEPITLQRLETHLAFFNKMYDIVRLVDPRKKRVLECCDSHVSETHDICHAYWGHGVICDNCISIRAYREKQTFYKLEKTPHAVMLVTAMPIDSAERPVVLEMLRNATDAVFLGEGEYAFGKPFAQLIRDFNDRLVRDHLTTVYNRRFLDERLPSEIVLAKVNRQPLTVIFADIDNLKWINDTYGHPAGDTVIQSVGRAIEHTLRRATDWVARYGGDEFLICLPDAGEDAAGLVTGRIRESVGALRVFSGAAQIPVRLTFGVETSMEESLTADELITRADRKMYESKHPQKGTVHAAPGASSSGRAE